MGMSSLQVCIDESDWLQVQQQGSIPEDNIGILDQTNSPITSPSGEDMLACSRPLMERRLRPPHEQSLKCPRCESTHTKFCYYNNYSLSQPRYFCKTCRRYWTKGGTLRNIPVGGGCRKNKKQVSNNSKKQSNESSSTSSPLNIHIHNPQSNNSGLSSPSPAALLSYHNYNNNFDTTNQQFDHFHTPIAIDHFMENNSYNGHEINFGGLMGGHNYGTNNFNHGICSQFGLMSSTFEHGTNSANYGSNNILESCQKMMVPFDNHTHLDVKPNPEVNLSIEWQEHQQQQQQACNSNAGKETFGYNFGGLGSWTGLMNGYGSSATHPLV